MINQFYWCSTSNIGSLIRSDDDQDLLVVCDAPQNVTYEYVVDTTFVWVHACTYEKNGDWQVSSIEFVNWTVWSEVLTNIQKDIKSTSSPSPALLMNFRR